MVWCGVVSCFEKENSTTDNDYIRRFPQHERTPMAIVKIGKLKTFSYANFFFSVHELLLYTYLYGFFRFPLHDTTLYLFIFELPILAQPVRRRNVMLHKIVIPYTELD